MTQTFTFSWRAWGKTHTKEISAASYGEACWRLGQVHAQSFGVTGVPPDFRLSFNDERTRLDEPAEGERK